MYVAARNRRVSTKFLAHDPSVRKYPVAMRNIWRTHVQGCLKRKLANNITIDEYAAFTKMPCHFCGSPPTNLSKYRGCPNIAYNGIDRLDNSKPYDAANVVSCCKLCNAMKSSLSAIEFFTHVMKISKHISGV